jgi:hypothetical protein
MIKDFMIEDLKALLQISVQQDLECNRCRAVKPDFMSISCPCSGNHHITVNSLFFGAFGSLPGKARAIARIASALGLDDVIYFVNSFII